jgi:DNA-binding FrmR family transcriptional regulator
VKYLIRNGRSEAAAEIEKAARAAGRGERSPTADDDCGGQLMLLAAVRGGVNGLMMGEMLETHIRFHLEDGTKESIAPELAEDLIDLMRAYLK